MGIEQFKLKKVPWTPHPYQIKAMQLMIHEGAAGLFLDPGLGKTSITLGAFAALKKAGYAKKMLVIAPMRVCYAVWPAEIKKWPEFDHLKVVLLHGRHKNEACLEDADVYLINPEGLDWYTKKGKNKIIKPDMLVVDESTKFKRSTSKRFKALKIMLNDFGRRYILTGTPTPKGLEDLFGQVYILDQGATLGKYITHFRREYFNAVSRGMYTEYTAHPESVERVAEKISDFTMRLKAEDYLDMPELVYHQIEVILPPDVMKTYKELEDDFMTVVQNETILAPSAAAASTKLRQLVNGGMYTENRDVVEVHTVKTDALVSLMEELSGAPLLVLYQFKHDIDRISLAMKYEVPYIGSGVSNIRAEGLCQQFNDGTIPLLLAHPASAGHGLNLQKVSNHVCFFGLPWDLELRIQAIKRVYRQGNKNTHVFVHDIIARGTIDLSVCRALTAKDADQELLMASIANHRKE